MAEDRARCRKGQCISVSGRVQFSRYRTREGERRSQLQVVADAPVAAASQRSRGGGAVSKTTAAALQARRASSAIGGRRELVSEPANPYRIPDGSPWFHVVNVSGGRSSAYMLRQVLAANAWKLPDRCEAIFANTGRERPETLAFVAALSERWHVPITWLEFDHDADGRNGTKYRARVVSRETASREGRSASEAIGRAGDDGNSSEAGARGLPDGAARGQGMAGRDAVRGRSPGREAAWAGRRHLPGRDAP